MVKKILFIGAYGIENAGDDLPMLVMMENLKKLTSKDFDFEFHSLTRHINQWEVEKYNIIQHKNLEYDNKEDSIGKWFRGLNCSDDRKIFYDFLLLIESMDILIIGAGNFFIDLAIDIFRGPIPLIWFYIHIAKLYDKKIFLYGISCAPLQNQYAILLTKEIIRKSDFITFRDNYSKNYINSFINLQDKSIVLPDPALGVNVDRNTGFLSTSDKKFFNNNNNTIIALGLRRLNFLGKKSHPIFKELISFINSNPNYNYIFVPQSTYFEDSDIDLSKELALSISKNINFHIIEKRYTPQELIKIYSLCSMTFAIRLHGAVFSCIAETPTITLNYLPKVKAFMDDYGLSEYALEIDSFSKKLLTSKIYEILSDGYLKSRIRETNQQKKEKTLKYAQYVLKLINSI